MTQAMFCRRGARPSANSWFAYLYKCGFRMEHKRKTQSGVCVNGGGSAVTRFPPPGTRAELAFALSLRIGRRNSAVKLPVMDSEALAFGLLCGA